MQIVRDLATFSFKWDIFIKSFLSEVREEKELEDSVKYGAVKDIVGGLFGGIMSNAMGSPELQEEINKKV